MYKLGDYLNFNIMKSLKCIFVHLLNDIAM